MWTFATLTLSASFEGPDLGALVDRCRALRWIPPDFAGEPLIRVDDDEVHDEDVTMAECLARAKRKVQYSYGAYPEAVVATLRHRSLQFGMRQIPIEMATLADQLATVPFELATFGSPYLTDWGQRVEGDPGASLSVGQEMLGLGAAFRGRGYERLVSRRWLDAGPWKTWRSGDVTLLQFHALDVDRETALAQALPGYLRFKIGDRSGLIAPYVKDPKEADATYDAGTGTIRVAVPAGREVTDRELLEWAAVRVRNRDPRGPVDAIAFVFASEEAAAAHLPRLWPYEHQCWTTQRLDVSYTPPDPTPAWARGPAFEFSEIELGEQLRAGTGDAVHRGRLRRDGSAVLVTVTSGHAEDPARRAPEEALLVPGIAPLVGLGRVTGHAFADALVEHVPAGRPATELAPLGARALAALGEELSRVIERANTVLDGIQPELIYVTDDGTFVALAPRGPRFIASATPFATGPRSYPVPYVGHEVLVLGKAPTPASDVFAMCASLFVLGTGRHPFGALDDLQEMFRRVTLHDLEPWPGDAALGELLARGLAQEPRARPFALDLISKFAKLAKLG